MTEYVVSYQAGGTRFFLAEIEPDLWGNIWSDVIGRAVRFPTALRALTAGREAGVPELSVYEVVYNLKRVCGLSEMQPREGETCLSR